MTLTNTSRALRLVLLAAGLHSIVWGCFIVLLPARAAMVYGLNAVPTDLFLWQGTGLIITLMGLGYLIAVTNPVQHWAVVLIGLLAKVLGSIGMTVAVLRGEVSPNVLWLLPINDVIWWWPFGRIVQQGMAAARK